MDGGLSKCWEVANNVGMVTSACNCLQVLKSTLGDFKALKCTYECSKCLAVFTTDYKWLAMLDVLRSIPSVSRQKSLEITRVLKSA